MPPNIQVIPITDASDGTGAGPGPGTVMVRNDGYFLDKIGERWAKEDNLSSAFTWRLDRLPPGYGGYEHRRGDSNHIDRYLYGHPRGVFRSINELYPHIRHLQDHGSPAGCTCKRCAGPPPKKPQQSHSSASSATEEKSRYFAQRHSSQASKPRNGSRVKSEEPTAVIGACPRGPSYGGFPEGRVGPAEPPTERKEQIDENGTRDIYRALLDKLQQAAPSPINEDIIDQLSPDWRAGHQQLRQLISDWQILPNYIPRVGELVLFTRNEDDDIAWDSTAQTFRHIDRSSNTWLESPSWEAGVVTQMPVNTPSFADLTHEATLSDKGVAYSRFRVEPLCNPNNDADARPYLNIQHKYVPLHLLRPLAFWKECLHNTNDTTWHPSIKHALTVSSSFCILSRISFRGVWPEATVFAQGVYLGPELLLIGDAVRLLPKPSPSSTTTCLRPITDIMLITSIKLIFVNLNDDDITHDDYDDDRPYNTCLHIQGRAYTLDPHRCFDGIGAKPGSRAEASLPTHLHAYGPWYHLLDPALPSSRLEVPFTRILGKCYDHASLQTWFTSPPGQIPAPAAFRAINAAHPPSSSSAHAQAKPAGVTPAISRGHAGIIAARESSTKNDRRIDRAIGHNWFWADSRVEQLALQEVNNRFVGERSEMREEKKVKKWRKALTILDGKGSGQVKVVDGSGSVVDGAKEEGVGDEEEEEEEKEEMKTPASAYGMLGGLVRPAVELVEEENSEEDAEVSDEDQSQDEEEDEEEGDAMEVDGDDDVDVHGRQLSSAPPATHSLAAAPSPVAAGPPLDHTGTIGGERNAAGVPIIELSDDDDESD